MCDDVQAETAAALQLLDGNAQRFLDRWHWFGYHARNRTPFMVSIARACRRLTPISADAPERMLRELASIGNGRDRNRDDYNQLIQKLSEILVLQQISLMPWPEGARLEIEGGAPGSPRQVDGVATLPDGSKIGFEVKSPAYLDHADRRGRGGLQWPARGPDGAVDTVRRPEDNIVLPRDNTIRDFLRSANEKFAAFKAAGPTIAILVIVWDDFIYEAISPLVHERVGLLTPNSYARHADGPELFPNLDAIVLLRHLSYFTHASAEHDLPDRRRDCMHLGGDGALPNVIIQVPGGQPVPDFVTNAFNALPLDHEALATLADYHANDLVMWHRV